MAAIQCRPGIDVQKTILPNISADVTEIVFFLRYYILTVFFLFLYTGQMLVHLVLCCSLPDCCKLHIVHIAFVFCTDV